MWKKPGGEKTGGGSGGEEVGGPWRWSMELPCGPGKEKGPVVEALITGIAALQNAPYFCCAKTAREVSAILRP